MYVVVSQSVSSIGSGCDTIIFQNKEFNMAFLILQQKDYYVKVSTRYKSQVYVDLLAFDEDGDQIGIGTATTNANITVTGRKDGVVYPNFSWSTGKLLITTPNFSSVPELEVGVYEVEFNAGHNSVVANIHYVSEDFVICDDVCYLSGRFGESFLPVISGDESATTPASITWTEIPDFSPYVNGGFESGTVANAPTKQQTIGLNNWQYGDTSYEFVGGDNHTGSERIWKAIVTRGSASKEITFIQENYNALAAEVVSPIPSIVITKQNIYQPVYVELELSNWEAISLESVSVLSGSSTDIKMAGFDYIKSNKFYAVITVKDDEGLSVGEHLVKLRLRGDDNRESVDVEVPFRVVKEVYEEYEVWGQDLYTEPIFVYDDKVGNPVEWDLIYLTKSPNASGSTEPDNSYDGLPDFVFFEGRNSNLTVCMNVKTAQMVEDEYVFPFYFFANGVRYKGPDITLRKGNKVRIRENEWIKRNKYNNYCTPKKSVPVGSQQYLTVDYIGKDACPASSSCNILRHYGVGYQSTEADVMVDGNILTKVWQITIPETAESNPAESGLYFIIGNDSDPTSQPSTEIEYVTTNRNFYVNFPYRVTEEQPESFKGLYYVGKPITFNKPDNVHINITSDENNGDGTATIRGSVMVVRENDEPFVTITATDGTVTTEHHMTVIAADYPLTVEMPKEASEETTVPFTVKYDSRNQIAFNHSPKVRIDILEQVDNGDGTHTANCTFFVSWENTDETITIEVQDGSSIVRKEVKITEYSVPLAHNLPDELEEEAQFNVQIDYTTGRKVTVSAVPEDVDFIYQHTEIGNYGTSKDFYYLYVYEEYEDATLDITISDGVNTITKTINIIAREPEEPEIPMANPTISFSKGLNLSFPKAGATRSMTVTYTDTNIDRINTPYSTEYGVTIVQDGTAVVDGNSITINYSVTVPSTTYKKDLIPMIFSCVGLNGSSCTETLYGTQDGETPAEEGNYIKLDAYTHTFPASGGSFTVTADFGFPGSSGLSVRVANTNGVYPITWCKATLKGGHTDDDGTEGHEDWEITMTGSSTITEPFSARITFSYTNYYGERASAEFIAIREAGDGEPETFEPAVQPYVSILKFKTDGRNDIQNVDYFNVFYQDFETGTIGTPISDVGWFKIVDSKVQETNTEGILMRYFYEVEPNELTVARHGEVTCYGNVDGVRYTATITLQQARYEVVDDDDDDESTDTGDIPVIAGKYIGQIWKDVEFNFGSQSPATYTIYMGDELIFSGKAYKRPGETSNKILVNKIVQDYLVQPQLDLESVAWYVNTKEFTLRNADGSRISHTYFFVNDWSYSDDFKTGNLSHHILNKQRSVRGQMFPFSIFGAGQQVSMEYGVRYIDGYTDAYGKPIEDWWSTEYITNGVSTDFFVVARRDAKWIDSVKIGDDIYYPEEPSAIPYVLYYVNPWGGYDWFPVTGKVTIKDNLTQYKYVKNYNNTTLDFGNSRYLTNIDRNYVINTNWLTQEESERMWYLLESNQVYLHDIKNDKIIPVIITDTELEHKKRTASQKLINYTFTCQMSHNRKRQ